MDRLNSSYYSLAELPEILNQYFDINITLEELIKYAEKELLITSFKAKGNSTTIMFGCKKIEINRAPSHVKYKNSILKPGYLGSLKLEDEYRSISLKVEGRNEYNVNIVENIRRKCLDEDFYSISLGDAYFDFTDFFIIPKLSYLNNLFNQSELTLSVVDFKYEPIVSSETQNIDIALWLENVNENNISISLPYTDIYVTHSHLYDFCRSHKKITKKIKEKEQIYQKLIETNKNQKEKIQSLEEQLEKASSEINKYKDENTKKNLTDLTDYFLEGEYPNNYLKTAIIIYQEVWVDYFINRQNKPSKKEIIDMIKHTELNNHWTDTEIAIIEKMANPIFRDQNRVKEISKMKKKYKK